MVNKTTIPYKTLLRAEVLLQQLEFTEFDDAKIFFELHAFNKSLRGIKKNTQVTITL